MKKQENLLGVVKQEPLAVYCLSPAVADHDAHMVIMTIGWQTGMYGVPQDKDMRLMFIRARLELTSADLMRVSAVPKLTLIAHLYLVPEDINDAVGGAHLATCKCVGRLDCTDVHELLDTCKYVDNRQHEVKVEYSITAKAVNNDLENAMALTEFAQALPFAKQQLVTQWKLLYGVHELSNG